MRLLFCVLAAGSIAASAFADVAFNNQNTLPATPVGVATTGPSSLSFNAAATRSLGDYVTLTGTDRTLTNVNVPMAIFAANGGSVAINPFVLPITLSLYAVDNSGANPAVGSLITSITQNVNVPGVAAGTGNRVYFNIDFSAIGMNITLPNSFIWSVGYDAISPGQAQSLNPVVTESAGAPAAGTYGDGNAIYIDSDFVGTGSGFQRGTFVDLGQFFRPIARFDAIPEPSVVVLLGTVGAAFFAFRRRR